MSTNLINSPRAAFVAVAAVIAIALLYYAATKFSSPAPAPDQGATAEETVEQWDLVPVESLRVEKAADGGTVITSDSEINPDNVFQAVKKQ